MIRFSWTRKVVTPAAILLLLLAVALGALATAEGQETQPTLPREPTEQEIEDFHRSLDVVSDHSEPGAARASSAARPLPAHLGHLVRARRRLACALALLALLAGGCST